jgi:hypothetical protein
MKAAGLHLPALPVPVEYGIRQVTCRLSLRPAACVYSLTGLYAPVPSGPKTSISVPVQTALSQPSTVRGAGPDASVRHAADDGV